MTRYADCLRHAQELDRQDPLKGFRERFEGLSEDLIYLDGNSLGPLPAATCDLLRDTVKEEWGSDLIRSWNKKWFGLPTELGDLLAPLIGARNGEVCFADSVTVNLFKLASAALRLKEDRRRILTDNLNFPSDYYALKEIKSSTGEPVVMDKVSSEDGISLPSEKMTAAIDSNTALVTVSHVVFKSGFMHDLASLTEAAHNKGALVLADLSHSVGSVPVQLEEWGVDMAVGCSYKYLNGGPGAPAFLYVRKSLQENLDPVLKGWFGTNDLFAFKPDYAPAKGILRFMVGTPPILSLRAVEPGIRLLREAGMDAIRQKSLEQTNLFINLWRAFLEPLGFTLGSPGSGRMRGSHISLRHPEAFRINQAMINPLQSTPVVIPDFRRPDNLRLGIAPLYTKYAELVRAVGRIRQIVTEKEYERFGESTEPVT